jgi:protein-S-isoprenylcysteine O-methyltransferase Ste14
MSPSFSGTRFAGWFFTAQALTIGAWWIYLFAFPADRQLFVPPGASGLDLLAFSFPDLIVAVPASLAAGLAVLLFRSRWALPLAWLAAGAIDYAFVYCVGWSLLRHGGWTNVACMAPAALLSTVSALDVSAGVIEIFRRASPSTSFRHVLATLGQIALFWSFFLLVVPPALMFVEAQMEGSRFVFAGQRPLAGALLVLCSALGLASGITMASRGAGTPLPFAAPSCLVATGPYAHLRNPMVVAGLGQGFAVGLWHGSWAVLAYVLLGGFLWNFLVRPAEERDLLALFGEDFMWYCRHVRCWIPRLRPFRGVR